MEIKREHTGFPNHIAVLKKFHRIIDGCRAIRRYEYIKIYIFLAFTLRNCGVERKIHIGDPTCDRFRCRSRRCRSRRWSYHRHAVRVSDYGGVLPPQPAGDGPVIRLLDDPIRAAIVPPDDLGGLG